MPNKIKSTDKFLKIIADSNRFKILLFLRDDPKCVCKIFPHLRISQKLASHHLAQLRSMKLVKQERSGNFMYYGLNKKVLKKYMDILNSIIQ